MKVLKETDYTFLGKDDDWYVFESKFKPNFDPERIYIKRVRFITLDGKSRFFEPKQEEFRIRA